MMMTMLVLMPMIPKKALLFVTTLSIMDSMPNVFSLQTLIIAYLIVILATMSVLILVDQISGFMTMLTNPC